MEKIKEYQKISNIYVYKGKRQKEIELSDTYYALKDLIWIGTEKIDGANTRIYWDGHRVKIYGATDNAKWNKDVYNVLKDIFLTPEFENAMEAEFNDKPVYLFGETYGPKLNGGSYYSDNSTNFILFDVNVDGWDLTRDNINDVAKKLGLDSVPTVFEGNLGNAITYMEKHPKSTISDNDHEMEGIVLVPKDIQLYDKFHKEIKLKCKYRDIENYKKNYEKYWINF